MFIQVLVFRTFFDQILKSFKGYRFFLQVFIHNFVNKFIFLDIFLQLILIVFLGLLFILSTLIPTLISIVDIFPVCFQCFDQSLIFADMSLSILNRFYYTLSFNSAFCVFQLEAKRIRVYTVIQAYLRWMLDCIESCNLIILCS